MKTYTGVRRRTCGALGLATTVIFLTAVCGATAPASAQQTQGTAGVRCIPVAERAGREHGCWITASVGLGELPQAPYWHLDAFPDRAAAEAAKGPNSAVAESLGRVWLFTVADAGWRPASGGERVAQVGPLPVLEGGRYSAQFMEGVFTPGMQSSVHRHSGPEAFHTVAGRMCVETPDGHQVVGAGESTVIPEGPPMVLTGVGTEERRSLVIILHDASRAPTSLVQDWTPRGLCRE